MFSDHAAREHCPQFASWLVPETATQTAALLSFLDQMASYGVNLESYHGVCELRCPSGSSLNYCCGEVPEG